MHIASTIIDGREFTAEHKKKSPIPMLARKLTEEGIDPSTFAQIFRGTTPILRTPVTLSRWTDFDISDDDVKGLRTRVYRRFDGMP